MSLMLISKTTMMVRGLKFRFKRLFFYFNFIQIYSIVVDPNKETQKIINIEFTSPKPMSTNIPIIIRDDFDNL